MACRFSHCTESETGPASGIRTHSCDGDVDADVLDVAPQGTELARGHEPARACVVCIVGRERRTERASPNPAPRARSVVEGRRR